jgi:fibronectin-binding autotransporter adhesin
MTRVIEHFRLLSWSAAVVIVAFAATARGQNWTGNANGNWSNMSNWSPTVVPTSGINTKLTFGLTTSPTMTDDISGTFLLNQMTFTGTSPTYTLGGNGLDFRNDSSLNQPSIVMNSNNSVTISNALTLTGNTYVIGTGTGTIALNGVINGGGGLYYGGAGTLILGNATNSYSGAVGTYVFNGTLQLGSGSAIPAGGNVTVNPGATFNTGGLSNGTTTSSTRVVQTLFVDLGTFRVPSGSGDYWINTLHMSGGSVDFTGSNAFWLHFANAGAGITIDDNSGTNNWIGAGVSRFQNNTASPLTVSVGSNAHLNVGVILSNGGTNPSFTFTGNGLVTLANTGNTANIINSTSLATTDLSTNLGAGAFGVLGTGTFTLAGGVLEYVGPQAATCAKPITLSTSGNLYVGGSLTMSGVISQAVANSQLSVYGPFGGPDNVVALTNTNTYSGPTSVFSQTVLAVPTIANGGVASPIGASSNAPANLILGDSSGGGMDTRGTLLLTGANSSYSTDRGVTLIGYYPGGGGAIGVQNATTTLTISGQITGGGSFIKTGAGTLVLSNATNNYAGRTYVEAGRLSLGAATALPAGWDVTMSSGTELNTNGFGIPLASAIGTLYLNGGAVLHLATGSDRFTLNRLVTDSGGGIIDASNASGSGVSFAGAGAAITINGNSTWAGSTNSFVFAINTAEVPITIGPFSTLNSALSLSTGFGASFRVTGGGTLHLTQPPVYSAVVTVNHARLQMDSLANNNSWNFDLTLDNGTLAYAGASVAFPGPFSLGPGGGTLEISNPNTSLTLSGTINGTDTAPLTKTGPGVLVLGSQVGSLLGGLIVSGGRLDVGADSYFGGASPTVNGLGTLRFTSSFSTARQFTLNGGTMEAPAGVNVTLNTAAVTGGFLKGPGTFTMNGGATLVGSSTANNAVVNIIGAASFANFSNSGVFGVAAGIGGTPTTISNFINQGSGTMTVGATSAVNAADFQSYGTMTFNPATVTENYSQTTLMTNTGSTPLYFNGGSRTIVGTPQTAVFPVGSPQAGQPTFVAGIDLNGKNAIVAGGLFVNNGYVEDSSNGFTGTGTVVADFGSLVKGAGFFQNTVITQNGGKFQAGNSPGSATFGRFVLGPGGVSNYLFAIDDATGTAGPSPDTAGHVSGWGLVRAMAHVTSVGTSSGDFTWTATAADRLTVAIQTLVNPTTVGTDVPGLMDQFDPNLPYKWQAVEWTGSYAGPTDLATLDASTTFDLTGFANPIAGRFGWALDMAEHTLSLTYTPTAVPEPGTFALLAAAGGVWVVRRRK